MTSFARHDGVEARHGTLPFVLGGALLGTIGVFLHEAHTDPVTATWFRCAFGLLGLTIWLAARNGIGALRLSAAAAPWAIAAGTLMVAAWALFFFAIARTTTGIAVVLFHVQPLWVILLGALWLHEAIIRRRLVSVIVAMAGLVLATGVIEQTALSTGREVGGGYWLGIAACLVGAFMTALVTLIAKRLAGLAQGVLAWWQCAIGSVLLLAWPASQGFPSWGPAWGWLAGLGLIHTGLAYTLMYAGMPYLSTARIAVLQFVYPAVAIIIDWLVLGESLGWLQLTGVAVMSGAIWFAERAE